MAALGQRTAVPSRHKMVLRSGAGNASLAGASSTHCMALRNKATLAASVVECVICQLPVGLYDDYLKCTLQCRKFHRRCFETWCGEPCLCKGLLCDRFPDPGHGSTPDYLNSCAMCRRAPYPRNQAEINRKWMSVFRSRKFRTYLRRQYPKEFKTRPNAFNPDHLIVTGNEEYGGRPRAYYNVWKRNGDSVREALEATWDLYRTARITFPTIYAHAQRRYCLSSQEYKDALTSFLLRRIYRSPQGHMTRRFRYHRLLYWHQTPINILPGAQPPYAENHVKVCNFSFMNHIIHTQGSVAWDTFRKMFERPESEWTNC